MLSFFIVGMDEGLSINELKELALEGELSIKALYNVKSSAEAKAANLIEKTNLRSLSLSWRVNNKENSQHENAEEILSGLQPHSSLKKLCIIDYQGSRFPYWMVDLLLPNLVELSLENCRRCDQLPPLGKLRFLKELNVSGMDALKSIDSNFYGDGETCFPSLETLTICHAPCLEEWTAVNGRDNFPLLSSLTISYCPKLVKLPILQSLKKLYIEETSVSLLSSVMMNAVFLTSLRIHDFHGTMDLLDGLLQNQKHLERLVIVSRSLKSLSNLLDNMSTLKHSDLQCCLQLESLPAGLQYLSSLESLKLSQCNSIVTLPVNGLYGLSSLSSLGVNNCEKLASLSEGLGYLTSLQDLLINGCPELTSLPESLSRLSSLRSLRIWCCQGLVSLPNEIEHLALLSELEIDECFNMMSLPQGLRSLTSLKMLKIVGCPHLEKRCEKERGEDWHYIAHIPSVIIKPSRYPSYHGSSCSMLTT
ncbi:hypothetical protein PTKIN_Ptkin12aG0046200 [Pterospermum kingtungense]